MPKVRPPPANEGENLITTTESIRRQQRDVNSKSIPLAGILSEIAKVPFEVKNGNL
jgi:hypothetical protein